LTTASRFSSEASSTVPQRFAASRIARVPFVVERTSVRARAARNSRGDEPASKPSTRTASRSPATSESGSEARSPRASSISLQQRTRSKPEASACGIVEVARRTSTTIPTGAETSSAGVNATSTRTGLG
jgi:hypothetical protein